MSEPIKEGMDFDEWREAWHDICRERGHILKADKSGNIDEFVYSGGMHNGPGCTKCGWSACMHCDWRGEKIPDCTNQSSAKMEQK
jgi:hypothetical protein